MSEVADMLQRYKDIRSRLRKPPNAVPDVGIDLKRSKIIVHLKPVEEPPVLPEVSLPTPTFQEAYCPKRLMFSSILEISANYFGMSSQDLKRRCREARLVFPRQIAFYLAAKHTKVSRVSMGRHFSMDHTTVLHAIKKIENLIRFGHENCIPVFQIEAKVLAYIDQLAVPAFGEPHLAVRQERQDTPCLPVEGIYSVDN